MDEFTPSSTSSSSNVFASNKKKSRIDSVALALANRMSSSLGAGHSFSFVNALPGTSAEAVPPIYLCPVCRLPVNVEAAATKTCSVCKRHSHAECVASDAIAFFEPNICESCMSSSSSAHLIGGDALLSSFTVGDNDPSDEEIGDSMSRSLSQNVRHNSSAGTLCVPSSAASLEDVDFAGASSHGGRIGQFSCASSPTTATPTTRSSTPVFPQDAECSDNDEYHPPGTIRKTDSTRGSRGKGRKPTSAALHRQSSSMRTRSFGKPPSTSYAAKFDGQFIAEEKPGGKKSRGNASKGKGGNRGRRPTGGGGGRGSKLVSMYASALAVTRHEQCGSSTDERRKEEDGVDKEYIRTCVVTSLEDKFMTEVSMCLVCGSIGKGAEGSMITCSCCAQSFHTYCVLMHDKLNPTVMKRGWRCLDCTVCEGCGSGEDEPNLLLCDECDISYHTYCLEPPLDCIPRGSWRCKWCATCSRCSAQIKVGSDLQRLEGFCEVCYSLRKCLKCQAPYEIGDLMLKCGRCLRWLHARCEGFTTEEQAENAAENSFRCSFCRPQTFNDALSVPVVVDNVLINKSAVDQIQSSFNIRKLAAFANFGEHFGNIARSMSYEQEDVELSDELQEQLIASVFAGRGRGCGRGGGPGRRMLKMGVGGFYVRTPKNRLPLMGGNNGTTSSNPCTNEEEQQPLDEDGLSLLGLNGKPRIRRPRRLKRPLLEDAYPAQIQESFFGVAAVDSRTLAEQTVEEPTLDDYKKLLPAVDCSKFASELSEHSAELLRTEQEMDMLGDIPLVDNIMEGLDIEGLDFSDLIVGEEDDEPMTVESAVDPINEGYNAGSSSNLVARSVSEVFSPSSCSSIRTPSRVLEPGSMPSTVVHNTPPIGQQPTGSALSDSGKLIEQQQQKQSAAAIAAERWEEDEPLGDKATKAAVHHAHLKDKFPFWTDRVRQINRVWRELNSEKRQEFVEWARKNRANCPTIRRRGRRAESVQQPQNLNANQNVQSQPVERTPSTTALISGQDSLFKNFTAEGIESKVKAVVPKVELLQTEQQMVPPNPQLLSKQTLDNNPMKLHQNLLHGQSSASFDASVPRDNGAERVQQQTTVLEHELKQQEARLEQLKKDKRAVAARQRLLIKKTQSITPEWASRHDFDLQNVQNNLDSAKKALQTQQRLVDRQRQRLKEQQVGTAVQTAPQPMVGQNGTPRPMSQQSQQQLHYQILNQQQKVIADQCGAGNDKCLPQQRQQQQKQQQQQAIMAQQHSAEGGPSTSSTQQQQTAPLFPMHSEQLQRIASQTEHEEQLEALKEQKPAVGQLVKGTRGRKRKKPLLEQVRTPTLGGMPFTSLETQLERDVFDTVDTLLGLVTTNMDKGSLADDALLVRKILSQQNDNNSASVQQLGPAKIKKRRQTQPKVRNQPDITNELDLVQERIKKAIETIPPITNYMEQYQANDKQMMKYPDQSALPDHEGSEPPLHGNVLGNYSLPFMPGYYDELESVREYVDEDSLLPPTMGEICADVDLNALVQAATSDDAQGEELTNPTTTTAFDNANCSASAEDGESLLHFLSVDQIGNRSKMVKSLSLFGGHGPAQDAPLEPHWSRFDEEPRDLDREVDVVLTIDPSEMSREEFVDSLCKILGVSEIDVTELDTPPYTPDSPNNDSHRFDISPQQQHQQQQNQIQSQKSGGESVEVKVEVAEQNLSSREKIICKNCNTFIPAGQTPIDETHGRLGFSEAKEEKIFFCSMQCYYKFLAVYRIPLNVESLEMAERHVDNNTLATLRQISADMFAKRINAGLPPHSMFLNEHTIAAVQATAGNFMESAVAQREFVIKSSELSALIQNMEKKREEAKGGFKWRGFGWNICDTTLIQSFKRQYDGAKQRFAAIHLQTNEKHVNWSDDSRQCSFCEQIGDGDQRLTGRLLNVDANKWVHVNCALWSAEVHVAEDGGLINVEAALRRAKMTECRLCGQKGASVRCYKLDCSNNELAFHLICAKQSQGHFVKDKTFFCAEHEIRPDALVADLSALRRIFVQRDENQLLSKIFNHSYQTEMVMRVGSLIFHRIGQLLPDQLKSFTTEEHIFPVGYRVTRLFWSSCDLGDRLRYECLVVDGDGKPEFCVKVSNGEQQEFRGTSPTAAWTQILHSIAECRANSSSDILRFFPKQMTGEYLYGFLEPAISKMLESLPGIDQLYTYTFKHGGTPLMDLPLAENPSGCARCEPCFRTLVKQRHRPIISNSPKKSVVSLGIFASDAVVPREGRSTRNSSARVVLSAKIDQEMLKAYKASGISERMLQTPYLRINDMAQLVCQYREMKKEWKSNVYLARSKIQGMGLYAKRDLDMNQMIIEYIGELIRNEVCELRQSRYIEQNRGEYMFRIDCDWVVDATMAGGLARYINHSCVVIFANRPIKAGEEFTYDYQFDIEETGKKIPCLCGAPNCVKWMN
uniref:Histone-lysine N-methyltransferase n=1 Tax=Globodera pallida TaxID=36090 RepID=A0A183BQZ3_GLOPA